MHNHALHEIHIRLCQRRQAGPGPRRQRRAWLARPPGCTTTGCDVPAWRMQGTNNPANRSRRQQAKHRRNYRCRSRFELRGSRLNLVLGVEPTISSALTLTRPPRDKEARKAVWSSAPAFRFRSNAQESGNAFTRRPLAAPLHSSPFLRIALCAELSDTSSKKVVPSSLRACAGSNIAATTRPASPSAAQGAPSLRCAEPRQAGQLEEVLREHPLEGTSHWPHPLALTDVLRRERHPIAIAPAASSSSTTHRRKLSRPEARAH